MTCPRVNLSSADVTGNKRVERRASLFIFLHISVAVGSLASVVRYLVVSRSKSFPALIEANMDLEALV